MSVVPFNKKPLYTAKLFSTYTEFGEFKSSGTLCGCVDFATPQAGTFMFTPDEIYSIIIMLKSALEDVLKNSDPLHDPRLMP
jgi:hypothetical protein